MSRFFFSFFVVLLIPSIIICFVTAAPQEGGLSADGEVAKNEDDSIDEQGALEALGEEEKEEAAAVGETIKSEEEGDAALGETIKPDEENEEVTQLAGEMDEDHDDGEADAENRSEEEEEESDADGQEAGEHHHHQHPYYAELHLPEKLRRPPPFAPPTGDEEDDTENAYNPFEFEADFPPENIVNGSFSKCYVTEIRDIKKRCKRGTEWGTGVYIPAFNRTGERTNERGETKSEYQLFNSTWYDTIKELKSETNLTVYGIIFEMDDLEEKFNLLIQNVDVFDGYLIDWEHQKLACFNRVPKLNTTKEIRYFMGKQDEEICPTMFDLFVNNDLRKTPIPSDIAVVFPCTQSSGGRCYRGFVEHARDACDPKKQRYMFLPWDRVSAAYWFRFEAACSRLGLPMPPHDFAQAL